MKVALLILIFAIGAPAQALQKELCFTSGWTTFLDEDPVDHFLLGASARFYVTNRWSVEPEVLYMKGPGDDRDISFIPHFAYDFGNSAKIKPYVIAGFGLLNTRLGVGTGSFSSNDWTVSGGLGVKIFLSERWFAAPEFRLGFEPIARATGSIGFRF